LLIETPDGLSEIFNQQSSIINQQFFVKA